MPNTEPDIEAILRKTAHHADEAEVVVSTYSDFALEQRGTEISSVFEHSGTKVYIRVVKEGRIGVSATSDITRINDTIRSAVSSAALSEKIDGWTSLPKNVPIPPGPEPYDPDIEINVEYATEFLERMNAGASAYPEVRPISGGVSLMTGTSHLMNTCGVDLTRNGSEIALGMETICEGSTGYSSDSSPFSKRIKPEEVGKETAYFASASRNGIIINSGKYDVVFSEEVVASLILGLVVSAVDGKNVLHGKSVYANKLQQKVAHADLTIADIPMHPEGNAFCRYDTEGTPTSNLDIIKNGVLSTYLYDTKTAALAETVSNGCASRSGTGSTYICPHCLTISAPITEVLSKPCLYVKDIIGAHTANPLTGDFSVETANAFLAEGGNLIKPVKKAMIAGNVFEILTKDITVSSQVKAFSSSLVPKMRISDMQIITSKDEE